MTKTRDFIDPLTAQLRVGRSSWPSIRASVTRYVMPDGSEFFDWSEIRALIQRTARPAPPEGLALLMAPRCRARSRRKGVAQQT